MESARIIFIGGIGSPSQFGGELTKNKEIYKRFLDLGHNPYWIDTFGANHSKFRLIRVACEIMYALARYPKATVVFSTSFDNIYTLLKIFHRIKLKRRLVYWVIGGIFGERVNNHEFDINVLKQINLFLVEGKLMKRQLNEAGFINVEYVPNFKTITKTYCRGHVKDNKTTVKFLFISRIMPQKGCDDIIESAKNLKEQGYNGQFKIDFYGQIDPVYESEFIKNIGGVPELEYKGQIDLREEDNYATLSKYDFMLFPTHWRGEGFPGVVIDAYKAGLPIISSDWNFNTEFIIDGETGVIVKSNDRIDLSDKIKHAIIGDYDIVNLSRKVCEYAIRYDTKNVITRQLISLIQDIDE